MIERFGRKMLHVCILLMTLVFLLIGSITLMTVYFNLQTTLDQFNDQLSLNDRTLPDYDPGHGPENPQKQNEDPLFYTIWLDDDGKIIQNNNFLLDAEEQKQTADAARQAMNSGHLRGWIDGWRYKIYETDYGTSIAFADGRQGLSGMKSLSLWLVVILTAGVAVVSLLLAVFTRRMMKPAMALEARQKQFITDAAHELKTPLTLMLTNAEILEKENGDSEWTRGIREEGEHMKGLIQSLITLTRADEGVQKVQKEPVQLSLLLQESLEDYADLMESIGLQVHQEIAEDVMVEGDPALFAQIFSILLENALKYCDEQGMVRVSLKQSRKTIIRFENTCQNVDSLDLERLFDRFYRGDASRSSEDGFGIGLSVARSLVTAMNGTITARKTGENTIGLILVFQ